MTAQKTAAVGAGVIVMALISLLGSTQFLEFSRWVVGELRIFWQLPLFGAVVVATMVGAVAPAWLPHLLPDSWPRPLTLRVTRLLASGIALVMVASQYRSLVGLQYACFAATGAYVLWTIGSNCIYQRFPDLQPASLRPCQQLGYTSGRLDALREVVAVLEREPVDVDAVRMRLRQELAAPHAKPDRQAA
ncbi:hypothetical protein WCE39_08020 [Luteimonas sp. MJ174]|uniref:hypothetical protein n=1 Tax=Luteimonas sp. MJ174 TaxID=3129237 RepID=UPI0031BB2617